MSHPSLTCHREGFNAPLRVTDRFIIDRFLFKLKQLYWQSTLAAEEATQYWADVATTSQSPLAPLAHVPGVFSALWLPDVAPTTATVLGTAGYGFAALPKHLIHFTTSAGAAGIAQSGLIHAMAWVGLPLNMMIKEGATIPIHLATPAGTVRILPYFVYVRWGSHTLRIAK